MFNLPALTFWLVIPWPFIWVLLAVIMYFIHQRQDKLEQPNENETIGD